MSHSLDIQGGRFVAELRGGQGSVVSDVGELEMGGNQYKQLTNLLAGRGAWVKRSGIPYGAGGQDVNTATTQSKLMFFPGTKRYKSASSTQVDRAVYYAADNASSGTVYAQYDESSSGAAIATGVGGATSTIRSQTFIDDSLIVSTSAAQSSFRLAGTVHPSFTATATLADGSVTVSAISSALTADQQSQIVGSWFVATGDSDATRAIYRIVSVESSTALTLDRAFKGSSAGAGAAIRISPYERPRVTGGIFYSSGNASLPGYNLTAAAWGRLVCSAPNRIQSSFTDQDILRLRWSGVVGSDEGTAPFTGIDAFDTNGYRDFSGRGASMQQIVPANDAVVVFQQRLLTVVYGQPVFDGTGSLDFSTEYECRYGGNNGVGAVNTPHGVFYLDRVRGLMLLPNQGAPVPISSGRTTRRIVEDNAHNAIAFFNDYVIMTPGHADSIGDWLVYHVGSDSFFELEASTLGLGPSEITFLQPGRGTVESLGEGEELFVGMAGGRKVADVGYALMGAISEGHTDDDQDGTEVPVTIETPVMGPMDMHLRPERVFVTYKTSETTDTNPYLKLTLYTGLPPASSYDSANTWTSAATDFPDTAGAWVTKELDVSGITRAPMLKIKIESVNKAKDFEVARVLVVGDAEGIGGST